MKSDLGWGKTTTSNPEVEDRSNVLLEVELSILDCNALANMTNQYEYNSTEEYEYEEYEYEGYEYEDYEYEDYNDTSSKIDCNDYIFAAGFGKKHLRCKRLIYTNLIFLPQTLLQADSGGPLTYKRRNQHVLVGELKFGMLNECESTKDASFYQSISYHRQWIEEKMRSPKFCGSGPDADA